MANDGGVPMTEQVFRALEALGNEATLAEVVERSTLPLERVQVALKGLRRAGRAYFADGLWRIGDDGQRQAAKAAELGAYQLLAEYMPHCKDPIARASRERVLRKALP
ncbi:MAG: hypothetical protein KGL39_06810 [Patescibacteria group bacterium]|nr:hypothetical protein [Patescibacteria group bacterium]